MDAKNFFALPSDMLSRIYAFDNTFKTVFSTEDARLDIRYMSQKIKQSPELIKKFIEGELNYNLSDHNLKIFLHPKEGQYTKFQILNQGVRPNEVDLDEFDGYICNEQQHEYLMSLYDFNDLYKHNYVWMTNRASNFETGLYLHTSNNVLND